MSVLNKNVSTIEPKHIQDNYLPLETLSDKAAQQRRLEHRKQNPLKLVKCARGGIERVITYDYEPQLDATPAWAEARSNYNAGQAAAALGVKAVTPNQWLNLETGAYMAHKSPQGQILLEPRTPQPQKNAFMQARVSVYPLLSVLNFKSISPLMSILWSDTKDCSLYDYYHFVRWYAQLRDGRGGEKRYIGDKRERLNRLKPGTTFHGAGLLALDACIAQVLRKPVADAERKRLEEVLGQIPATDPKHEFLRALLGSQGVAGEEEGGDEDREEDGEEGEEDGEEGEEEDGSS